MRFAPFVLVAIVACADTAIEAPPTPPVPAHAAVMAFATADLKTTPGAIDAFLAADLSGLAAGPGTGRPASAESCSPGVGTWGDVTGDAVANIIDAQQVARFATLLWPSHPELIGNADVYEFGLINIIDAQQIARYSVGLPTNSRAGQIRCE